MSGLSLPVNRSTGRALLVAGAGNRARALEVLREMGFGATELDDPYAAMTELCRRPLVYRAMILSLASLYREELSIIAAVKARFPHVEVWLAQTDGRQAALAEGLRLGADGLLSEDGLHRLAHAATPVPSAASIPTTGTTAPARPADPSAETTTPPPARPGQVPVLVERKAPEAAPAAAAAPAEPLLTADELRALLQEQSSVPPDNK